MADRKLSTVPSITAAEVAPEDGILVLDRSATTGTQAGPEGTWKQMSKLEFDKFSGAGSNIRVQQVFLNVPFAGADVEFDELYTALNAHPEAVVQTAYFTVVTNRNVWIDSTTREVTRSVYYIRGQFPIQSDGKAYYGVNHQVGADRVRFYRKERYTTRIENGVVTGGKLVALGDIGTTAVETAFIAASVPLTGQTLVVTATQGGTAKEWIYVGDDETTPVNSDFLPLPTDSASSDPADPSAEGIKIYDTNGNMFFSPLKMGFGSGFTATEQADGSALITYNGGSTLNLGQYETEAALEAAHPAPSSGSFASINPTDADPYSAYWDSNSTPNGWKYGNASTGVLQPEIGTGNTLTFDRDRDYNPGNPHTSGNIVIDNRGTTSQNTGISHVSLNYPVFTNVEPSIVDTNGAPVSISKKIGTHSSTRLNIYFLIKDVPSAAFQESYTLNIVQDNREMGEASSFTLSSDSPTQNTGTIIAEPGASGYSVLRHSTSDFSSATALAGYDGTSLIFTDPNAVEGETLYYSLVTLYSDKLPSAPVQKAIVAGAPFTRTFFEDFTATGIDTSGITTFPTANIPYTNWAAWAVQDNIHIKEENGRLNFIGEIDSASGDGYITSVGKGVSELPFDNTIVRSVVVGLGKTGSLEQALRFMLNIEPFAYLSQIMIKSDTVGDPTLNTLATEHRVNTGAATVQNHVGTLSGHFKFLFTPEVNPGDLPTVRLFQSTNGLTWNFVDIFNINYGTYSILIQGRFPSRANSSGFIDYVEILTGDKRTV